ncbi:MAG: hypothetical protein QOI88_2461 [Gammaproteobacteria bacterium]|jgi:hypothetical protein|nr:hypothetical protein [Gammaproteobacteria bacterium]
MMAPQVPSIKLRAARLVALPEWLGACAKWGDRERRIAAAVVKAHLLEPKAGDRRRQNQLRFIAAEINEIEPLAESAKVSTEPDLRTSLSLELPLLVRRSVRTLHNALTFDANNVVPGTKGKGKKAKGKRHGRKIRSIITAGFVVLVMYSRVENGARDYTPEAAITLIGEKGKTNSMFLRSEKEVKTSWRHYQPVAHLAAALLQYISEKDLSCFRNREQEEWRSDIVEFLQYAEFFQHFLKNTLPDFKPKLLRTKFHLFQLPVWLGVTPSQPVPIKEIGKFVQRGSPDQRRKRA